MVACSQSALSELARLDFGSHVQASWIEKKEVDFWTLFAEYNLKDPL